MREVMAGWLTNSSLRGGADAPRAGDGHEGLELRELDLIGSPVQYISHVMNVIGRIVLTDG